MEGRGGFGADEVDRYTDFLMEIFDLAYKTDEDFGDTYIRYQQYL